LFRVDAPVSDLLAHRLGGLGADRRKKAHEELPVAILGPSRLEGVPEEVELDVFVIPWPVVVLAVHDASLGGMQLQIALFEPTPDGLQYGLRLTLGLAVHRNVIRIAFERDARELAPHPGIECVMQKEVGEQRTDHRPLRAAFRPLFQGSVRSLYRRSEPS
jgi:hypothetical protein